MLARMKSNDMIKPAQPTEVAKRVPLFARFVQVPKVRTGIHAGIVNKA
jgi:hypothetical protein